MQFNKNQQKFSSKEEKKRIISEVFEKEESLPLRVDLVLKEKRRKSPDPIL